MDILLNKISTEKAGSSRWICGIRQPPDIHNWGKKDKIFALGAHCLIRGESPDRSESFPGTASEAATAVVPPSTASRSGGRPRVAQALGEAAYRLAPRWECHTDNFSGMSALAE